MANNINNHAHGAFGAQIIGNRNLTPHTTSMSLTPQVDVAEDTGMSPPGDHKTYLQGPRGMAGSSNGLLPNIPSLLADERRHLSGTSDDTIELLSMAWFGFGIGMYVSLPYSRKTSYSIPVSNSTVVTTSVNHQCTDQWFEGHSLFNPFGSTNVTAQEVQTLTFTATDIYQFHALRASGETELTASFNLNQFANDAAVCAYLKSAIEGLAAYTGQTVTVTTLSGLTGSATKSATYQIAFSQFVDAPELEVRSGAVHSFVVTSGDAGNYTSNGGANFNLGLSESTFQTNQRALSGQYSAVVSKGTSALIGTPAAGVFLVTGSAISGLNGTYTQAGTYNTLPYYTNGNGFTSYAGNSSGTQWIFTTGGTGGSAASGEFYGGAASLTMPISTDWLVPDGGSGIPSNTESAQGQTYSGTADFKNYFPVAATPTTPPTKSGTGAVATSLITANSAATTVAPDTTTAGGDGAGGAIWNPISSTTTGTAHDANAFLTSPSTSTSTGFYARLQLPLAPVSTGSLTVIVEHSDSAGSGYSTLCTFTVTDPTVTTQLAQEYIGATDTTVKRYVRARISAISGTFAVAVCYSRISS